MPSGVYYQRRVIRAAAAGVSIAAASSAPAIRESPWGQYMAFGLDITAGVPCQVWPVPVTGRMVKAFDIIAHALPVAYPNAESISVHLDWIVIDAQGKRQGPYTTGTTQYTAPLGALDEVVSGLSDVSIKGPSSPMLDSYRDLMTSPQALEIVGARMGWLIPKSQYQPGAVKQKKKPTGAPKKAKPVKKAKFVKHPPKKPGVKVGPKPKPKPKQKPKVTLPKKKKF